MQIRTFVLLVLAAWWLHPIPAGAAEQPPPILNSLGEKLENPRIKSFDGTSFEVIHSGGVSRIPWDEMPEVYRTGYVFDADKGAREQAHRQQQARRDMQQTQRRENNIIKDQLALQKKSGTANLPAGSNGQNSGVRRVERSIPMLAPIHLKQLGGPNVIMAIQQVNPLEIQFRLRRGNWQTVPLKTGTGDQLTFLFDDGAGCRTYFLDRMSRNQNEAILVFERKAATPARTAAAN